MGFGFWVLVGLVCALSVIVLGALALVPLLVIAGATVILVRVRPNLRSTWVGVFTGFGLVLLYVGLLNLSGPGTTCWRTAAAAGCDEYLNPWPWLLGALALIVPSSSMVFVKIRSTPAQGDNHHFK